MSRKKFSLDRIRVFSRSADCSFILLEKFGLLSIREFSLLIVTQPSDFGSRAEYQLGGQIMRVKSANGSVPAYKKIRVAIRTRIESGDLRPGDVVSSEREVAKIHQVSLMTARHALDSLQREGVVERRRGFGTFVAAPKIQFNKLMGYTEPMASRGLSWLKAGLLRRSR